MNSLKIEKTQSPSEQVNAFKFKHLISKHKSYYFDSPKTEAIANLFDIILWGLNAKITHCYVCSQSNILNISI